MWSSFQIQIGNKGSEYKQWCHDMGKPGGHVSPTWSVVLSLETLALLMEIITINHHPTEPASSMKHHGKISQTMGSMCVSPQPVEPCSCETNILCFMRRGIQSLAARHVVPFRIKAEVLQVFRQEGKHHQTSKDNGTSVLQNCTVWFAGFSATIYISDMWNCII